MLPLRPFESARVWKIVASAGTGKSYTIERTIKELMEDGVGADEICYTLFNKQPAETFVSKFYELGVPIDMMRWWCTSHALAKRLLKLKGDSILDLREWGQAHGFALSGSFENDPENAAGWDAEMASLSKKIYEGSSDFTRHEEKLLAALHKTEAEEGRYCHVRYLQKALSLMLFPPGVRYLFIDEAQDLSKIQFDWVASIIRDHPEVAGIMLAGDDRQAINGFKGADYRLFLQFPADRTVNLLTTYRMAPAILREANGIIAPVRERSELIHDSARTIPGIVLNVHDLRELEMDFVDWLKEERKVLVLARNRCWLDYARGWMDKVSLPTEKEWHTRHRRALVALSDIRETGIITEDNYASILPSCPSSQRGELRKTAYWDKGVVDMIRRGDFKDDPSLMAGYELLRFEGGVTLDRCENVGLLPSFKAAVMTKIPDGLWNLSREELLTFDACVKNFGLGFSEIRLSTIHSAKGEEADVVVILTNLTTRSEQAEQQDEDNERRVAYVGATRARDVLVLTKIASFDRTSRILI